MRGESFDDRADDARLESERAAEARSIPFQETLFSETELGLDPSQRVVRFLHAERWTGASLALHALALFCMALMPPKSSALALDLLGDDARYARYLATPVELDPPAFFGPVPGPTSDGARADGSEGAAGAPEAPRKPGRASGRGTPSRQAPDARTEARAAGILGVLPGFAATLGSAQGPFAPDTIDTDAARALASLIPGGVGDGYGFHGLGMRGTGRGGGGDAAGTIGVGDVGGGFSGYCGNARCLGGFRGRDAKVPPIRSGVVDVRGSLSKEVIRRAIQRHLNEVRFCYTEGLRTTPELAGRVQVMFVISSAGTVQDARVVESDLHQPGVERCIADAVRRWSFPAPDGGGYVSVRYPFVFEHIGQ
jgi:TonB family protein